MVETDTLFQTKIAKKNIPFRTAHTYVAYIRDYLPPRGEKRVANYESHRLRKRD